MTRKQAILEEISRQCKLNIINEDFLPTLPLEIKIDAIKRSVTKQLTFRGEWYNRKRK